MLAGPFLKDEYFMRSVVIIAEHNNEGSFGFILNKEVELNVTEALKKFPKFKSNIFLGGPVMRDNIYFIHTYGNLIEGSQHIVDDIYWGGDFDVLKKLIKENKIEQSNIRFLAGYSGWEPHQLDKELKEKSWIVAQSTTDVLLKQPSQNMWATILKNMGDDFSQFVNYPIDPQLN